MRSTALMRSTVLMRSTARTRRTAPMCGIARLLLALAWLLAWPLAPAWAQDPGAQRAVGPADFRSVLPLIAGAGAPRALAAVHIDRFLLDRRPVTNREFLEFVHQHPEWRRDRVPTLFADQEYLSHWESPERLGAAGPEQPVTRVSWYAARAFCEARHERLPTWYEWELAAAADTQRADARADPGWSAQILAWYAEPAGRPLGLVGQRPANFYGIEDLHGLVWEWVEDFNSLLIDAESRAASEERFCGAGALSLQDRNNYAMLMRIAFLSALEARSTVRSLGFRCAADAS